MFEALLTRETSDQPAAGIKRMTKQLAVVCYQILATIEKEMDVMELVFGFCINLASGSAL